MPDCKDLARRLRRYSRACVADKLDADFSAAVREAAGIIEQLPGDPEPFPKKQQLPERMPRYPDDYTERELKALKKPLNQTCACTICRKLDVKADMIRLGARRGTWGPTRALCYLCQACFDKLCEAAGTNPHDYFN